MTTERNIIIHAGQTFELSLDYAGTPGRGQRMHIRASDAADDVIAILTHNGADNARVIYNDATQKIDIRIGASVSGAWLVGANRVEWKYDIEDYDVSDDDDIDIPFRGASIVYGNRTRPEDVTPSAALPSGDGRYVRFDTDAQGLSDAQKLAARTNIGVTGGGGSGDVVGPASATDDRIAAFDGTTGKLIKQGSVTATAVASHLSSTSNPHSVTAAQVGADPAGTAASAVSTHAGAADPHGDRAYADGLAANYATAAQGALADSAVQDIAAEIHAATEASIADADEAGFWQSASSALRRITWTNIKASIKTYADTLYAAISHTHALSGVTDSGATSGQVPTWSGSAWVPQTPSGASPGGSGSELQYRGGASTFGAMAGTAWDNTNRSLAITGATVTANKPIFDLTQTFNNGSVNFQAVNINVINTASGSASGVQQWQVNGATIARIQKDGLFRCTYFMSLYGGTFFYTSGGGCVMYINSGANLASSGVLSWSNSSADPSVTIDTQIVRDAANRVAIRRTTNAQTLIVSGTYTDASNYVQGELAATSTAVTLSATTAGTGADDVPVRLTPAGVAQVEIGNGVQFTEMSAPSAPAANKVILYAQDNGAGKTQLMALFPTGVAQQVAIEP